MLQKILKNLTPQQIARLWFQPQANCTSRLKLISCTLLNKLATHGSAIAYARRGFKPQAHSESRLKTTKIVNFLSISVGFNRLARLARDLSRGFKPQAHSESRLKTTKIVNFLSISVGFNRLARLARDFNPWRGMALNDNAARFELKPTKDFMSLVFRRFALIGLFSLSLTILAPGLNELDNFGLGMRWVSLLNPPPVLAQLIRPQQAGPEVYKRLPDFPQENTYVNRETGKVDPNNTLAVRLIGYHMYVKGRPPNYRLDWKLTLADYLGANELIEKTVYPGHELLKDNPIEGDRAAINRLNRSQREALINALVSIFNPESPETSEPKAPVASPTPEPELDPKPQLPQPGSADLLKAL